MIYSSFYVCWYTYVCVWQGRTNVPPNKVPWDAIRTLLSQCIYGGKIDNEFDQVNLDTNINMRTRVWFNRDTFNKSCKVEIRIGIQMGVLIDRSNQGK